MYSADQEGGSFCSMRFVWLGSMMFVWAGCRIFLWAGPVMFV